MGTGMVFEKKVYGVSLLLMTGALATSCAVKKWLVVGQRI